MAVVPEEGAVDQEAVTGFLEEFASTLITSGIPRMPARVFSSLMISERGRLTAAELGERLQVSAAAVSGAVQYLDTVHLVRRVREPGSRRDVYVVEHDVWYQATVSQDVLLSRWIDQLGKGEELLGARTPAGERLRESREFFAFLRDELASLRERWAERRRLSSSAAS